MSYTKAVLRTIFYQYFFLFVGLAVGFILNAEWVGYKSCLVERSINNIFFPVRFDEDVCQKIKNWGAFKLWAFNDRPKDFQIIEDGLLAEEFYIAKFQYKDSNGNKIEKIQSVRIRWKTWEYYWEDAEASTPEELRDYIENGTINSNESDKALKLYRELKILNNSKVTA